MTKKLGVCFESKVGNFFKEKEKRERQKEERFRKLLFLVFWLAFENGV